MVHVYNNCVTFVKGHTYTSIVCTFLFICVSQFFCASYGVDILDTGYFLTAYEQVFDAPLSVSATMGYYLTNVFGGWILMLFPQMGIFGFRIVGAAIFVFLLIILFCVYRKVIPVIHIILGSLLVVLGELKYQYFFDNGLVTCFIYVIFLLLLYRGLYRKNRVEIFISGVLVGLNIFVRLPNILSVSAILIVLLNNWFLYNKRQYDWYFTIVFTFGIFVGCLLSYLLICLLGHQQIIADYIGFMIKMGNSGSGGHSWGTLLIAQFYMYSQAFLFLCLFYTIFAIDRKLREHKQICLFLFFVLIASAAIFYHVYLTTSFNPLWAFCLAGCLLGLWKQGQIKLLSVLSLFMLLVEPYGSNSGYNQGCLPAILAAPIASFILISRRNFLYVFVACLALGLQYIKQGVYGDFGPIWQKQSQINVLELNSMRTTKEKADLINCSLPKLKSLISPGDTFMVYDAFPLINYLTHTRPVGGQPWPALDRTAIDLNVCITPPKILVQRASYQDLANPTGNQMMDAYMKEHQYKIVWENSYFILLFPYKNEFLKTE